MESSILEDYNIDNIQLPTWYKIISIVRILWLIDIIYFFFKILLLYRASSYLKMETFNKEVIPVTIMLLPSMFYYIIQAKFEFKRSQKSRKNIYLKMYSLLILISLMYFGYNDVFSYFYANSFTLATLGMIFFYLYVVIIFCIDVKYLWDRLVLYNTESLKSIS